MANPEHLKVLKQGVEAWHKWRWENPDIVPDFSEANLTKTNLSGFVLGRGRFHVPSIEKTIYLQASDFSLAHLDGVNQKHTFLM